MISPLRGSRRVLHLVHLWLGLVAGGFIVAMGLTGFILVLRPLLEDQAPMGPTTVKPNLAGIEDMLRAVHPGARISRVTFPASAAAPTLVQAETADRERLALLFDTPTGALLGPRIRRPWLEWIADFHQNLLNGKTGRAMTGWIGGALFVLSLSGLISWFVGQRDWRRALAIPDMRPWRRGVYLAHRWSGLWANVLLLVVAGTGIVLAIPDAFQAPSKAMSITGKSRSKSSLQPLDDYVRAAQAAFPDGHPRELRLRGKAGGVSLSLWEPSDLRPKGGTVISLDPATAAVVSVERSSQAPLSRRFVELCNAVHKVELGGWLVRGPWSMLGLLPAFLMVSGIQVWWFKRRGERRRAVNSPAAAQGSALATPPSSVASS